MHTKALIVSFAALGVLMGCARQDTEISAQPAEAVETTPGPASMPALPRLDQLPDVLVEVGDAKLSKQEALQNVEIRLAAMGDTTQVEPARLEQIRAQMLNHVADQFIARTLLLNEAERQGIEITETDEQEAYERISAALPEGQSLEQIMEQSPLGEKRMREEVRVSIIVAKLREQVAGDIQVLDAEIDAFVEANKERLTVPENVHARHILLKTSQEDDEAAKAAKKEKAETLRKELAEGADFAEMAAEHSEGPSKDTGGDLGSFPRGRMVPPFEEAAFGQEIGVIGPVVETQFGYHIIEVLEHKAAEMLPREQVLEIVKNQKAQSLFAEFLNALKGKAKIKDFRAN